MGLLTLVLFVKFVAVAALVGGALAVAVCRGHEERRRLGFGLVLPGFGATWTAGFLLAQQRSVSLLSAWVLGAMGLSMLSILVLLFSISKPERDRPLVNVLFLLPLLGALFFMIWRPE